MEIEIFLVYCIRKLVEREGLSLCGLKVSGCTMLAPKNPTTLVVGVVSLQIDFFRYILVPFRE